MDRRIFGAIFLSIGVLLYASRYLCAAIYGGGSLSQGDHLLNAMYGYVGGELTGLAMLFFAGGVIYFLWGEWERADKTRGFAKTLKDFWTEGDRLDSN